MTPVIDRPFDETDGIPGTHGNAAVTGDADTGIDVNFLAFFPKNTIRTALNTPATEHALVMINADPVSERNAPDAHATTLPMIG
jgi:hypothetical protein